MAIVNVTTQEPATRRGLFEALTVGYSSPTTPVAAQGDKFLKVSPIRFRSIQIKPNVLVKHNGTVGRLKPCLIRIEGA